MPLLAGQRTCDLQVAVRVLTGHHCVVALGKLLTSVCLCHQAVFGTGQGAVIFLAGKVTAGMVESNGSLPPGL